MVSLCDTAILGVYILSSEIESKTLQAWERSSGLNKMQIDPNSCSDNARWKYKNPEKLNSSFGKTEWESSATNNIFSVWFTFYYSHSFSSGVKSTRC